MTSAPRLPALSVVACITGNFLLRAASSAALSILALYLAYIDAHLYSVPATFLGLLAAAFYTMELLFSPVFGAISDRVGRRIFMWMGGLLGAGGALLLAWSPALPLFVLARATQGLSTAASLPAVLGYLAAVTGHSEAVRGRIMVAFETATVFGFAIGFAVGSFLWDRMHVAAIYIVVLLYLLATVVFLFVEQGPAGRREHKGWRFYEKLLRHVPTLSFAPAWIAVNAILGMWFTHLGFQMAGMHEPSQLLVGGYTGSAIGLVSAAVGVVFVIGTVAWAWAFGRFPTTSIMAAALLALAFFSVVLYVLNHTPEEALFRIRVLLAFVGVTLLVVSGFTPAALAYLAELSERFPENRGSLMGLYSVFLGVGQLLGGWVGGVFAETWGVDGLIFATVLFGMTAIACLHVISRPPEKQEQPLPTSLAP